ncbi:glutamine--fructose-6-phosphate transaminase (isomerizing) [Pseudonocardia sp. KRD-184]|uniref:Glutamine--fructose-6-phosphate aminotransferase [isomerizing] n=1 Tax=Pseudonocardia oceani TaxID=2792013 RepID=A0ABS6U646_9PSEU|nr:glutamine--fructose-6-phosphate transaminase (isomerizing) [Pseudonocardia oceani]MBW0092159.1 glutamine--fructose-6-phosphate transaminase (isomerizing) [Pseudonocardia oceani]MBW0099125.1 glutamine--fructose-6-phosphate transaminase (isomerizing) [Pseudonocardia oceani]MBW0111651.1 glutamine--fructose-6-phosphate transaminase (isomerizing) [Pseudonocardia oceani]MBW0125321.1 glutamine--fructose-6-phosphate transaminase (isomerizing) [Pseudonocardia oceani]MBW0127698.1 glutamine--fructose-
MCGIVGYVGPQDAAPILLEGLGRLEYRGYDSAGVAVMTKAGLKVRKVSGRVSALAADLPARFKGAPGIGHTRWATHGGPTPENAHPHTDSAGRIAVVHNGIIENAEELRAKLTADGVEFVSQTDTECVAHLVAAAFSAGAADLEQAVRWALRQVVGAYGLAVVDAEHPDRVVVARNGSPVLLGVGEKEMFVASDVAALVGYTRQVVYLDDGELASLTAGGYRTFTLDDTSTAKSPSTIDWDVVGAEIGDHAHFLIKEIEEQPTTITRALAGRLDERFSTAHLGGLNLSVREAREFRRVKILGCGSACYAGDLGAQLIEDLARLPATSEAASEFRYRNPVVEPDTLYVAVSQSGETVDTLAAVQELQRKGGRVIGIVNVVGSTIARQVDGGIYLHAGAEMSVAATKSFTSTVTAFALLALHLGRIRDLSPTDGTRIINGLAALPDQVREILKLSDEIAEVAREIAPSPSMMFVGRRRGWPVAREGAQKLKEISYIHAEAYPSAELKHGPLALISPEMPTVAIVPDDDLLDKNTSTLSEIKARSGPVIALAHRKLPVELADRTIVIPRNEPELDPILLSIPLQLLAYHAAVALERDVDKPRNLAKSVTVE